MGCASSIFFIIGYLVCFFTTLWGGGKLLDIPYQEAWQILGPSEDKMKALLAICPVITVIIGIGMASATVISDPELRSGTARPVSFFGTGLLSLLVANVGVFYVGALIIVGSDITGRFLQALGPWKFKILFHLLAPGLGFMGGVVLFLLIHEIYQAQRE